jgi:2-polyprenyl-6-methoxyphenol hydroxylase-like FAD-dependent oxidoreductase
MTKVLITGAGIAGPAAAIALHKAGIRAEIAEARAPEADAGAFLTLTANGIDALQAVDAAQPVLDASFPATRMRVFDPEGKLLADSPLGRDHPCPRTITRTALSQALRQEAARRGIPVRYATRLTTAAAAPGRGVTAAFADGSQAQADLLIGADGIRSPVRTLISPAAPSPRYTGLMIACGYADDGPPAAETGAYDMCYGTRGFFGYTTAPDTRNWWFARIPAPELTPAEAAAPPATWRQRLAAAFSDDRTPAATLIQATSHITVTSAYDIPTLPNWHNGSMIVIGDAAHAASPSTTQGASMALEDSVALAQCLRDIPAIPDALGHFEHLRRDRAERVVQSGAGVENPVPPGPGSPPRRGNPPGWLYSHHIDWNSRTRDTDGSRPTC